MGISAQASIQAWTIDQTNICKDMKITESFSKKHFTPLLGIQYSGGRIEGNDGALVLMMFAMCMQKDNNKKNLYLSRAR